MNRLKMAFIGLFAFSFLLLANAQKADSTKVPATPDTTLTAAGDTLTADSAMALIDADLAGPDEMGEGGGLHKQLKQKFIEGSAGFMSLVALALVLGLAFCIERIVYLTLSEVNTRKLMDAVDAKLGQDDVEGAKNICRDTRGPVASICYQALLHIREPLEQIDRQLTNWHCADCQDGEGLHVDSPVHCGGSIVGISRNRDRYGDGLRPDSDGWRHQPDYRGQGYEGGSDYNHLRYCGRHRAAVLL